MGLLPASSRFGYSQRPWYMLTSMREYVATIRSMIAGLQTGVVELAVGRLVIDDSPNGGFHARRRRSLQRTDGRLARIGEHDQRRFA